MGSGWAQGLGGGFWMGGKAWRDVVGWGGMGLGGVVVFGSWLLPSCPHNPRPRPLPMRSRFHTQRRILKVQIFGQGNVWFCHCDWPSHCLSIACSPSTCPTQSKQLAHTSAGNSKLQCNCPRQLPEQFHADSSKPPTTHTHTHSHTHIAHGIPMSSLDSH